MISVCDRKNWLHTITVAANFLKMRKMDVWFKCLLTFKVISSLLGMHRYISASYPEA